MSDDVVIFRVQNKVKSEENYGACFGIWIYMYVLYKCMYPLTVTLLTLIASQLGFV